MLNNDEGANPVIPTDITAAIGKYKNQITDLEIEARRLKKFSAEKSIELARISGEIKNNKEVLEKQDADKKVLEDNIQGLNDKIEVKEKESNSIEAENKTSKEMIAKRETEMIAKERVLKTKELEFENKNDQLSENIKKNAEDTAKIETKKQILLETIDKL